MKLLSKYTIENHGKNHFPLFRPAVLFLLILVAGCAQIVAPDGGAKDTRPPHVVSYSPDSAATNFTKGKIYIRFDEYVQLKNIRSQLIVSPPVSPAPEVRVKGKGILIDLGDSLKPNTTYSINFGASIADIHEGTILENFRYVFSTGASVDSLSLGGKVVDAFTTGATKDAWVMLYETQSDSAPLREKPSFVTRTAADGTFRITNLHSGRYKIFALADENADFLYNAPTERIAFLSQPVDLNTSFDTLKLRMFIEGKSRVRIKKTGQPMPGVVIAAFSRSPGTPSTRLLGEAGKDEAIRFEFSSDSDSLFCYLRNPQRDSLKVELSDNGVPFDTLKVRLQKADANKNSARGGGDSERKFTWKASVNNGGKLDIGKMPVIRFDYPMSDFKAENIQVFCGKKKIDVKPEMDRTNYRSVKIEGKFEEDSTYRLLVPEGTVTDYFGLKNDSIKITFTVRNQSDYGTMKLKIRGLNTTIPHILQVLDEKGTVIQSMPVKEASDLTFENLLPGGYLLRMIDDENSSGKWDTGDYLGKRQPEMVRLYPSPLKVRASWDLEIEWGFK